MLRGFLFALGACFVWGLLYVVPAFMQEFSVFEVVMGCYFFYGILSATLLFSQGLQWPKIPMKAWRKALLYSFISNIFYYMGVLLGLRYTSAPLTVLLMGMYPLVIAFYGNWQTREISYKKMIGPSAWMAMGLILVHATQIDWTFKTYTLGQYMLGVGGALAALLAWSWYAVQNSHFLKAHPSISGSQWSTILGLTTLFWVVVLGLVFTLGPIKLIDFPKILSSHEIALKFLAGSLVLGFLCSWVGSYLLNKASAHLPFSLLGPFLLFETLFGLLFVFLMEGRLPTTFEFLGIFSVLSGIAICIVQFRKTPKQAGQQ